MKSKPRLPGKGQNQTRNQGINFQGILRGLLIGWIWTFVLLIILSLLTHLTSLSDKVLPLSTVGIGLVSSLVAGYQAAARARHRGLLHGALTGGLYSIVLVVAAALILSSPVQALDLLWKVGTLVLAGAIGGIIGV